jgi:tyrosyl-tRNA synthetase
VIINQIDLGFSLILTITAIYLPVEKNLSMNSFIEELRWRGMLQDMTPEIDDHLKKGMASAYLGFDPTADSLHIGHLVGVMTLLHFQRAGHKPFALIGGATGMIGDPSFKSSERNLLQKATLDHNVACLQQQLAKFLDFSGATTNKAELVNNYDWISKFSFLEFIRDVGKHITGKTKIGRRKWAILYRVHLSVDSRLRFLPFVEK